MNIKHIKTLVKKTNLSCNWKAYKKAFKQKGIEHCLAMIRGNLVSKDEFNSDEHTLISYIGSGLYWLDKGNYGFINSGAQLHGWCLHNGRHYSLYENGEVLINQINKGDIGCLAMFQGQLSVLEYFQQV